MRQQLTAAPVTTYTSAAGDTSVSVSTESSGGSFLDRYLRQPPVTSGGPTVVAASGVVTYKPQQATAGSAGALHGGLTVDLPSPDSGIGEATVTPRENGQLSQVRILQQPRVIMINAGFTACCHAERKREKKRPSKRASERGSAVILRCC